jgi:cation-transporting P-type ATPase C
MKFEVVHSVPGRIRLHVDALHRSPEVAELFVKWLSMQPAVTHVVANIWSSSIVVTFTPGAELVWLRAMRRITVPRLKTVRSAAATPISPDRQERSIASQAQAARERAWPLLLPMGLAGIAGVFSLAAVPGLAVSAVPLLAVGAAPVWIRALNVLRIERRLNVDFLDGLAIAVALLHGEPFTAAVIVGLIAIGDYIREKTAARSKKSIRELLQFQGKTAWVLRRKTIVQVPAQSVKVGNTVIVHPGDMIPVDGVVLDGCATVDQKTITGESMPVVARPTHTVYAGTTLHEGKLKLRAQQVGEQTTAARIVQLIETAPVTETRVQNYAEKFADRLVTPWLMGATALWAATGNIERFLSMLIIDYGTGIRVAAPTSILACMTAAAHQGVLVKSGGQMERLANVDTIVFDKTGTLTRGTPEVLDIITFDKQRFPAAKILQLAAAVEARLKHPIAEALVAKARRANLEVLPHSKSHYQVGLGIEARVNGYSVHVGNSRFFRQSGIEVDEAQNDLRKLAECGCTTVLFAVNGQLVGLIPCTDQVRDDAAEVIAALHSRGVRELIMVTGDNATAAKAVGDRLGIDRCIADTLPAEKVEIVRRLQQEGRIVAMVGDGINDSPALAYADIGISMKHGADVARESADVVLMEDSLRKLITAIDISRQAMSLVKQNVGIIGVLNTLAFALSLPPGLVRPGLTASISNGSAILASLNAVRPLLGNMPPEAR